MEVHKFFAVKIKSLHGNFLTYKPHGPFVVWGEDFDRVTSERDALHQRLNAVEEENDRFRSALTTIRNHTGVSGNQIDMIDNALENRS